MSVCSECVVGGVSVMIDFFWFVITNKERGRGKI